MPFGIGTGELVILLVVLLLVFGAKRLPEMGRSLGKGMREFKEGVAGAQDPTHDDEPVTPSPARELPSASSQPDSEESPAETERQTVS